MSKKYKKDSLGNRMKQYEAVTEHYLVPKLPFIIRVDGKAFHTFTKKFEKPFDAVIEQTMRATMESLCKDIPGCVLGYTQSDEITLVCIYTDRIVSKAWFDGRIEKIVAISAAKATKYFNKHFRENIPMNVEKYVKKLDEAEFDARVFNLPEWDCINNVIWRQQDAIRNSIEMVGHCFYSARELNHVNTTQIKEKLRVEHDIVWEHYSEYNKQGVFCYKTQVEKETHGKVVVRNVWVQDFVVLQDNREWFAKITGLSEVCESIVHIKILGDSHRKIENGSDD